MNKNIQLILLALLFSVFGLASALSCRALKWDANAKGFVLPSATDPYTDVQWWAFMKPPVVKDTMGFFSSAHPEGALVGNEGGETANHALRPLFRAIVDEANKKNDAAMRKFFAKGPGQRRNLWSEFAKDIAPQIRDDIKVLQIWFNDQPSPGSGTKELRSAWNLKKQEYPHGHSKYILSINTNGEEATLVQHSFPALPDTLHNNRKRFYDDWVKDYVIFPQKKNVFLKSQHAVCVTLNGKDQVLHMLELLRVARPKAVDINFHQNYIMKEEEDRDWVKKLVQVIQGDSVDDMKKECETSWKQVVKHSVQRNPVNNNRGPIWQLSYAILDRQIELYRGYLKNIETTSATNLGKCSKVFEIEPDDDDGPDAPISFMATVPQKKPAKLASKEIYEGTENDIEVGLDILKNSPPETLDSLVYFGSIFELGPAHWLAMSQFIDAPLKVSFWKNDPLPPINIKGFAVETVSEISLFKKSYVHGSVHEKVGASSDSTKPYVCFSDSNHRGSEITHAGLIICIRDQQLHKTISSSFISLIKTPYAMIAPNENTVTKSKSTLKTPKKEVLPDYNTLIALARPETARRAREAKTQKRLESMNEPAHSPSKLGGVPLPLQPTTPVNPYTMMLRSASAKQKLKF